MTPSKKTSAPAALNRPLPTNIVTSEIRWSCSIRDESVQARKERLHKLNSAHPGQVLAISCRGHHSDKSLVRSISSNCIVYEPRLSAVLARDHASMCLIPVENQVSCGPLLHQVFVYNSRSHRSHGDRQTTCAYWFPASAREAVLGRM